MECRIRQASWLLFRDGKNDTWFTSLSVKSLAELQFVLLSY